MAEKKASGKSVATKRTQKPAKSASGKASKGFTDEERAAMKEYAEERKAAARRGPRPDKADGENDLLAKIATPGTVTFMIAPKKLPPAPVCNAPAVTVTPPEKSLLPLVRAHVPAPALMIPNVPAPLVSVLPT